MSNFFPARELHLRDLQALSDRVDDIARRAAPGSAGGSGKDGGGGCRLAPRFLPFDVIILLDEMGQPVVRMLGGTVRDSGGAWPVGTPGQWGPVLGIKKAQDFRQLYLVQQLAEDGSPAGWTMAAEPPARCLSILVAEYTLAPGSTGMRMIMQHVHGDLVIGETSPAGLANQICADSFGPDDVPGLISAAIYAGDGAGRPQIVDGVLYLEPPVGNAAQAEPAAVTPALDRPGNVRAARYAAAGENYPQVVDGIVILPPFSSSGGGCADIPLADQVCSDMAQSGDRAGLVSAVRHAGDGETAPKIDNGVILLPAAGSGDSSIAYELASGTHASGGRTSGRTLYLYKATSQAYPGLVQEIETYNPASGACVDAAPRIENGKIYVPDRQYAFDSEYFTVTAAGAVSLKTETLEALADEVANEIRLEVTVNGILATDGGTEYTDSIGKIGLDTTGDGSLDRVIAQTTVSRA